MSEATTPINVAFSESGDLHLRIATGASRVRLRPGADAWVEGTYRDPSGLRPPKVTESGGTVTVGADRPGIGLELARGVPEYDLRLGGQRPYRLSLELGATDNEIELGGLPLRRVEARLGAGRLVLRFSEPMTEMMTLLSLGVGAGSLDVRGLGNADPVEMVVEGGAAAYVLHFDGEARRGGHAKVSTGLSSVELVLPAARAAKVTAESVMGSVQLDGEVTHMEGAYWTPAARQGAGPLLTVEAHVTLGTLRLRTV